jgi:hypothetical protein
MEVLWNAGIWAVFVFLDKGEIKGTSADFFQ